jgi:Tfp pilus assembly protein PilE
MSTEKNEMQESEVTESKTVEKSSAKKEKKSFFDCKSLVFIFLFLFVVSTDIAQVPKLGVFAGTVAFIVLLVCAIKNLRLKEYGLMKKIGVFIIDFIIAVFIVMFASMMAEKAYKKYVQKQGFVSCTTSEVKSSLEDLTKKILVDNDLISKDDLKDLKLTISNMHEIKKIKTEAEAKAICQADLKIENMLDKPVEFSMDYNLTLDRKKMTTTNQLQLRIK